MTWTSDIKHWNTNGTPDRIRYKVTVDELDKDDEGNRTQVSVSFYAWSAYTGGWQYDGYQEDWGIIINGTLKGSGIKYGQRLNWNEKKIGEWVGWIEHDPDGTKTISINAYLDNRSSASYVVSPTSESNPLVFTPECTLEPIDSGSIHIFSSGSFVSGRPSLFESSYKQGQIFVYDQSWKRGN